jgi:ureidoglycolate hydrolase
MKLVTSRASAEAVARFGAVVLAPAGEPTSAAPHCRFWSDLAHFRIEGETEIGLCTVSAQPGMPVASLERHARTPEILVPIDAPFAVPLMRDGDAGVSVLRVELGEALVIDPMVWHGACLPIGQARSSYFVIFRRGTPREDVETRSIPPIEVEVA